MFEQALAAAAGAADRPDAPWLAPYRDAARRVARCHRTGRPLADALNGALAAQPPLVVGDGALRFVPQQALPAGEPYEAFIARTAGVPTRDNPHDLFNALVWLTFPRLKARLNSLHAAQIARAGVAAERGALRDALTLFDENAALWQAPPPLEPALRRRDWQALFVTHREAWRDATPILFGHALLEKLLQPRKSITAHVWLVPHGPDLQAAALETMTAPRLAAKPFLALPVLGVPGWWPANASPGFYDDAEVFRPLRG